MAGNGPAPKPKDQRVNNHAPSRGEWVDLYPLEKSVLPDLPERAEDESWSAAAIAAWRAWREDPVTSQYSPADIAYAIDAIRLYEVMTPSRANEVRLRMDSLGLTPKGKRDLRWRVVSDDPEEQNTPAPKAAKKKNSARRGRLSVVK
jgi:hypothetical protein